MARAANSTSIRRAVGLLVAGILLAGVVVWLVSHRTKEPAKQALSPEALTAHYAYIQVTAQPDAAPRQVPSVSTEPAALAAMNSPFPVALGHDPAPLMAYLRSTLPDYSTSLLFSGSAKVSREGVCSLEAGPSMKDPLRFHFKLDLKLARVDGATAAGTYQSATDYVHPDGTKHTGTQGWRFQETVGKCRRFLTMPAKDGLSTLFLTFASAAPVE